MDFEIVKVRTGFIYTQTSQLSINIHTLHAKCFLGEIITWASYSIVATSMSKRKNALDNRVGSVRRKKKRIWKDPFADATVMGSDTWTVICAFVGEEDAASLSKLLAIDEMFFGVVLCRFLNVDDDALDELVRLYDKHGNHMCKTNAKKSFKLTDRDLEKIVPVARRNPHYKCAAPMLLYKIHELYLLAKERYMFR